MPRNGINPDRHHAPARLALSKRIQLTPSIKQPCTTGGEGEKINPSNSMALDLLTRTHQRPDLGGLMVSPPLKDAQ